MSKTRSSTSNTSRLKRLLPLAVLGGIIALVFATGLHRVISLDALVANYQAIRTFVSDNGLTAMLIAGLIYATATALSLPVGWIMTVAIGLLFGWLAGGLIVIVFATIGASALYFIARYALEDFFKARAGERLNKLADGFRRDAVSYMLFLRLVPAFPFALVNFAPGILGVPFVTYFWTTLVGIAPGSFAYAIAGEGLASVIEQQADAHDACVAAGTADCGMSIDPGSLITPELLIAFAALGVVSLIPVVWRRLAPARG